MKAFLTIFIFLFGTQADVASVSSVIIPVDLLLTCTGTRMHCRPHCHESRWNLRWRLAADEETCRFTSLTAGCDHLRMGSHTGVISNWYESDETVPAPSAGPTGSLLKKMMTQETQHPPHNLDLLK